MAQKAAKTLAARNTTLLQRRRLISLAVHGAFWLLRGVLFRTSLHRRSVALYLALGAPAALAQVWFEKVGRPRYRSVGGGDGRRAELVGPGEDLEAPGLMEWLWDVVYWTDACLVLAALVGDRGWWAWLAVPAYSIYLAYTTFVGARRGMAGMAGLGADEGNAAGTAAQSKRQQKMEKRGGQRVVQQHR